MMTQMSAHSADPSGASTAHTKSGSVKTYHAHNETIPEAKDKEFNQTWVLVVFISSQILFVEFISNSLSDTLSLGSIFPHFSVPLRHSICDSAWGGFQEMPSH
jgi:hypothetical protein